MSHSLQKICHVGRRPATGAWNSQVRCYSTSSSDSGVKSSKRKPKYDANGEEVFVSYEEFSNMVGEEMLGERDKMFRLKDETEANKTLERRMKELRKRFLEDDTRNKQELQFNSGLPEPEGTITDHVHELKSCALITHMVPVDLVRPLIESRFTINSIVHEKEEYALITLKHQQGNIHPYRGSLGKKISNDSVQYYTYVVDRTTNERIAYVFSYYSTPSIWVRWFRFWWSTPIHQFGSFVSSITRSDDNKKYSDYSFHSSGGPKARAGAVNIKIEDTGFPAEQASGYAGFRDTESALVFLTSNFVECYQQLDWTTGRADNFHPAMHLSGSLTIGKLLSSETTRQFAGETGVSEPVIDAPSEQYPWVQFWDLLKLQDRNLHSVLLFNGPMYVQHYMPLHIFDEQTGDPIKRSKFRLVFEMVWSRMTRVEKQKKTLSDTDYEHMWKQGKFT